MTRLNKAESTLNAKLFVRIIPTIDINYDLININACKKVLYVRCLQDLGKNVNYKDPHYWAFCTDGVFWNSSQAKIYETVTAGLYDDIFDGVNAVILSYGQTGSGKTATTSGLRFQFQSRGLALRILSQLFEEAEKRRDFAKITFGISYVEFCGETLKDLIGNRSLNNVRDVREYRIQSEECAWELIFSGECRKSYVFEAPYKGSNRCHSVLTFYTHSESLVDTDPNVSHSKIHLVDMAGFGNLGDEASSWKNKSDLAKSNLTKTFMERLIICLTERTRIKDYQICPYKSSRFLLYLNDALNPKSLIRFVAHVYGNIANLPLTISTLKFGVRIRDLKPAKLERIVEFNYNLHMKNLEKEYQQLKEEMILTAMLQDSSDYGNISQERLQQIRRAAADYLSGELDSLTLISLGQTNLTLEVFKDLYQKLSNEKDQVVKDALASAKEMIQNHMSNERNGSISTLPSQRASKRRSRQQDSQTVLGGSNRSNESGQISSTRLSAMVPQQVGYFDKKGISIGPGKSATSFEGNITKAFKKLKSKRSDGVLNKVARKISTKDYGVMNKGQQGENPSELSLPAEMPTRESAWQNFYNENPDLVAKLRSNIENAEVAAANAKQKYLNALAELSRTKREIEVIKSDFENCQHIHHICRKGEFDEDGNPIPGELEKELMNLLTEKQGQLNVVTENCHVALIDLKSFVENVNEGKQALEDAFQEFCKENHKILFPGRESFSELELLEEKDILGEKDSDNEKLKDFYYFLQQSLFDYVPPTKKKEWKNF